jgi:hypothetical protein
MKTRLAAALIAALPLLAACEPDPFAAPAPPTVAIRSFSPGTAEGNVPNGYAMKIYRVVGSGRDTAVVLHSAIHVAS